MTDVRSEYSKSFQQTRNGRRFLSMLVTSVVLMAWAGCKHEGKQGGQMPGHPPAVVTTAAAVARDVPVYLNEIGKILPIHSVSIVPQVGGKIIASQVEDGAFVNKGDVLFEIDPRPFVAALAAAKASLQQSKAELNLANDEYRRVKMATAAISQMEVEQKENAVAVAEAKVAAGEAAVDTAALNVEYTKVYSPITGRAGAVLLHSGNIARENGSPLLMIQQLDPIYAEFTINENDLGAVRGAFAHAGSELGDAPQGLLKVEVQVPYDNSTLLTSLGAPNAATRPASQPSPREGKLTFLDNAVQGGTGTVKLRATVPNADRYFWPGQFVHVRLVLANKEGAVLVPAQAQQMGQQGPFVYVVGSDATAQLRPIVLGQRQGNLITIESGVKAGEQVVVTGQMMVMPGAKVAVANGAGPATSMPAQANAG